MKSWWFRWSTTFTSSAQVIVSAHTHQLFSFSWIFMLVLLTHFDEMSTGLHVFFWVHFIPPLRTTNFAVLFQSSIGILNAMNAKRRCRRRCMQGIGYVPKYSIDYRRLWIIEYLHGGKNHLSMRRKKAGTNHIAHARRFSFSSFSCICYASFIDAGYSEEIVRKYYLIFDRFRHGDQGSGSHISARAKKEIDGNAGFVFYWFSVTIFASGEWENKRQLTWAEMWWHFVWYPFDYNVAMKYERQSDGKSTHSDGKQYLCN